MIAGGMIPRIDLNDPSNRDRWYWAGEGHVALFTDNGPTAGPVANVGRMNEGARVDTNATRPTLWQQIGTGANAAGGWLGRQASNVGDWLSETRLGTWLNRSRTERETPGLAGFVPEGWSAEDWGSYQEAIQNFDGNWPTYANGVQCDCADTGFRLHLDAAVEAGMFDSVEEAASQFEYLDWNGNRHQVIDPHDIQAEDMFKIPENFSVLDRPEMGNKYLWDSPALVPGAVLLYRPTGTTPQGPPNYTGHWATVQQVDRNPNGSVSRIHTLEGYQDGTDRVWESRRNTYDINELRNRPTGDGMNWIFNLGQNPGYLVLESIGVPNPY